MNPKMFNVPLRPLRPRGSWLAQNKMTLVFWTLLLVLLTGIGLTYYKGILCGSACVAKGHDQGRYDPISSPSCQCLDVTEILTP